MENREHFDSNAITDDIENALKTRLCEDLDDFIANSTPEDFWTREMFDVSDVSKIKTSTRPTVRRLWLAKAVCLLSILGVVFWSASALLTRYFSSSKDYAQIVEVDKHPSILDNLGAPSPEPLPTSGSQDLLADILTVVDYAESKDGSNGIQWKSLVRLSERGVSAVRGKFADYYLVQSGCSIGSPLKLIVSSQPETSLDSEDEVALQEANSDYSFDDALVACIDSLNDVGSVLRCDPYFWVVETVLSGD